MHCSAVWARVGAPGLRAAYKARRPSSAATPRSKWCGERIAAFLRAYFPQSYLAVVYCAR
jgi:hypothetical protein